MAEIKDTLKELNPWWKEEFKLEYNEREIYQEINKFLKLPQIIAITGLRRVGKTTIMLKVVEEYLKKKFDPKSIIYFSFDEFKEVEIRNVLKAYEEIMEKNIKKESCLLLLDEIQKLNDWENQIKTIYDINKKNIKIIISGSESLFIKRKAKETLAGRIYEFKIETLTFKEFLSFKKFKYNPVGLYERELKNLFEEYISTLGFPELVGVKEKEIIRKYIKENIIEKVIYSDMQKLFNIKEISTVESLVNIFIESPGEIIEISKLADELNISRQTASNYLEYLEESFLIRKLYNFSNNRRKVERKLKKIYPSIISPNLLFKDDNEAKSKVFEWILVNNLKPEFFWRDQYKNEVDIILFDEKQKPKPIEIKYGKIDYRGVLAFIKKFKVSNGFIISNKEEIINNDVKVIPAFKFLLQKN